MKSIRSISAILLVVIFMIPAAGLYITRHSCKTTGEITLALDADYSCCGEENPAVFTDLRPAETKSCCSVKDLQDNDRHASNEGSEPLHSCGLEDEADCCSNEGHYLKTSDEYTISAKASSRNTEFHISMVSMLPGAADLMAGTRIEKKADPPPLIYSSRQILIEKGSFLI